ncbi:RDD family protein [Aquimarina sp. AU474]|uniref:RDD family protein n=1 Tax=Aquimarina sp. AU474 TaxID=2108529 RepID=UPI001356E84C|nr:RDD family protein [Aquimarina sp. AU474]
MTAYLIDCIICYSLVMLVIQWAILSNIRESLGITEEWFKSSLNMELYVLISISIPVWAYFVYFDSNKTKGTFGKRILKLSVRDQENKTMSLSKSFQRTILKLAPWEIAHLGVIFPTPIYFENEPDIRILTIVGILLFSIYMISIVFNTNGQSLYDKLIGTKVIEK